MLAWPAALPPFFWPTGEGERPSERPPPNVERLGHDGGTFLVVRDDGSVASVQPSGDTERFVNSSRDALIASLELVRDAWQGREALSEDLAAQQARELRKDVAACDEAAVSSEDHWWSLVIEQLEHGLL